MFSKVRPRPKNMGETIERKVLTRKHGLNGNSSSSSIVPQRDAKPIEINGWNSIYSVAFSVDGRHIVSGGAEEKIRRWDVEDGKEVGTPIDGGGSVSSIAVTPDGKWLKAREIKGHSGWVRALDVSLDATRIATASGDKIACVWSLSTGEHLLEPLQHSDAVVAIRFSRLIATTTYNRASIRIYGSHHGRLLVDVPIRVSSVLNQSLAWTNDSKQPFALSCGGDINCLDVSTGTTRHALQMAHPQQRELLGASHWQAMVHSSHPPATPRSHFGTLRPTGKSAMAISANYNIVTCGGKTITLRRLRDILPHLHSIVMLHERTEIERADPEGAIDSALRAQDKHSSHSTTLSLGPTIQSTFQIKWVSTVLIRRSVNKALRAATKYKLPRFDVYQAICDVLEWDNHIAEAIMCFRQTQNELAMDTGDHDKLAQWELAKLEKLSDIAVNSRRYHEATEHFSTILSLDPVSSIEFLIKRSSARASVNSWGDALSDADEVIELDPSFHQGYERKYVALHGVKCHAEAVEAFDMMLLKLEASPDDHAREHFTIRHMPRVLIDTTSDRLYDKTQQAEAFEALPIYNDLVSSMMTEIDYARIWGAVKEFYRYVMLSHKREYGEHLLQKVEHISVYQLESSLANIKLQTFCSLVRFLGFWWAWSDACCVNKLNNTVLQESLVAMFTWY
ncbi:hypothetical protein HD554DRAFT_2176084 [Boletus coccyginus]|nr:hypothetical protein HD554DRAFT_2176084 [Boletus coccyginus]